MCNCQCTVHPSSERHCQWDDRIVHCCKSLDSTSCLKLWKILKTVVSSEFLTLDQRAPRDGNTLAVGRTINSMARWSVPWRRSPVVLIPCRSCICMKRHVSFVRPYLIQTSRIRFSQFHKLTEHPVRSLFEMCFVDCSFFDGMQLYPAPAVCLFCGRLYAAAPTPVTLNNLAWHLFNTPSAPKALNHFIPCTSLVFSFSISCHVLHN